MNQWEKKLYQNAVMQRLEEKSKEERLEQAKRVAFTTVVFALDVFLVSYAGTLIQLDSYLIESDQLYRIKESGKGLYVLLCENGAAMREILDRYEIKYI